MMDRAEDLLFAVSELAGEREPDFATERFWSAQE